MKKLAALIPVLLIGSIVFAQTLKRPAIIIDSVKNKLGKTKIVDGTPMLSSNDIIENITLSKKYSILLKALDNAGLIETFKSKGPITIFAPDDQAFAKLAPGQLDSLLQPSRKYDLSYLLTYHAIAGRVTAKDISRKINSSNGTATFTTIAGSRLTAKIDSNRNIVLIDDNGGKSVISRFDIPQSNGMLHVVNAVLVPKVKPI